MNLIFGYPAVYWSVRIFVMLVTASAGWMVLLMLARFFRPKHILAMVRADPPKVDEISGEFRGFKARITFGRTAALDVLEHRIAAVEMSVQRLLKAASHFGNALSGPEQEDGDADAQGAP